MATAGAALILAMAATALSGAAAAADAPPATAATTTAPATTRAPAPGRYDAKLCVAHADAAPTCGPAEADVRPGGTLRVRVSDIVYTVHVRPRQGAVVVMHGAMQIDEFLTDARWDGSALRFADADKQVRYEVRVSAPASRRAPR